MSAFEQACLNSFCAHGYEVTLFGYAPVDNLPSGVRWSDANEIVPPTLLHSYIVHGKPSVSHFSDYFRYNLLKRTDHVYVDTDVLLLKNYEFFGQGNVLGLEDPNSVCNAVMQLDRCDPRLDRLIEESRDLAESSLEFAATGPRLLTRIYGVASAKPAQVFFPVYWADYLDPFLPDKAESCRTACSDATTLHLWNSAVESVGYWKQIGPPVGSYLHRRFKDTDGLRYFSDFYPASVLRKMAETKAKLDQWYEQVGVGLDAAAMAGRAQGKKRP